MSVKHCLLILFIVLLECRSGMGGDTGRRITRNETREGVTGGDVRWPLTYRQGELVFEWDPRHDSARVVRSADHSMVWQGSLLPSFWLEVNKQKKFVKAVAVSGRTDDGGFSLELKIGGYGRGRLDVNMEDWGIRFSRLEVDWSGQVPAIIEMYFGASDIMLKKSSVWPTWDRPFMPDWQSFGFCVPGAKGGTPQSYFRMWDFGQANIALGSFGPSSGTPYGAAYPRPLLFAGMGSDDGFVALGAGSIPDGAMSLRIQSTRGCFQYVYNEDIWGALPDKKRVWMEPLRISLGDNAWLAFKRYYQSFPSKKDVETVAPVPVWNTWGMWGQKKYLTRPIMDFTKQIGAQVMALDDPWEASQGAGKPNLAKFPHFFADIDYARGKGIDIGVWETVGWIADPFAAGLSVADLIVDRKGRPCKANWNFDPSGESYYCLDVSSSRAREFIKQRTVRIMQTVKPAVIKLDFGYGLPFPTMGVPRDPRYRGERYAYALTQLIAETAKRINPGVAIQYYSISPMWLKNIDVVAMDDQGDLWYAVAPGHQEWSLWGSLLSDMNIAVSGSSGYKWEQDDEVVLNTAILGPPGAVLSIFGKDELPVPDRFFNRRLAIDRWYRKPLSWTPCWLNSRVGDFTAPPAMKCWGRLERDSVLTALVLRGDADTAITEQLHGIKWKGRWALISQDDASVFATSRLALIPMDEGEIAIPYPVRPVRVSGVGRTGEVGYNGWQWANGWLTIRVTKEDLEQGAGVVVERIKN